MYLVIGKQVIGEEVSLIDLSAMSSITLLVIENKLIQQKLASLYLFCFSAQD